MKAVLFDFDDLMIHSAPLHKESSRRAFAEFGVDFDLPPEVRARLYGRKIADATQVIIDHMGVDIDKDAYLVRRKAIFLELVSTQAESMPGLDYICDLVHSLGHARAVASSGQAEWVRAGLSCLGRSDYFHAVATGCEVERGKPSPDVFLLAAERLGVVPEECVVLEDAHVGVLAAKAAGMKAIGIHNCYNPHPQDLSAADLELHSLADVTSAYLNL